MKTKATTTFVIDTRKALKNGKYPVKLRVTFRRKQRYYPANLSLLAEEFDKVVGKNPKGQHKTYRLKFDALEQKANKVIDEMGTFDFASFSKRLYTNVHTQADVFTYFSDIIKANKQKENLGTASNYNCSMNSLKKFRGKLTFMDVTVDFLEKYEAWLLAAEKSVTTVSMYVRSLRAVVNQAISDGILPKDYNYPFGSKIKRKYQIPTSRNIKKSLTMSEIKLFFNYKPVQGTWEEKGLDFWIFSYLGNGMNMKDIANLRHKDIDEEYIKFVRAKTRHTNNVVTPITIYLTDDLKRIIAKWGTANDTKDSLVFPILNPADTPEKRRAVLQQFIKMVNKYMRIIAKKLGINKPCTTYYARHSFSTVLKRSGANVQFISEALGHSSINTTKAYLDSFEDDTKKEMAKVLTDF